MEVETILKQWGNSLGIIIPKKEIKIHNLRKNEKVIININKQHFTKVKDLYGMFPQLKDNTEKAMKQINKELDIDI